MKSLNTSESRKDFTNIIESYMKNNSEKILSITRVTDYSLIIVNEKHESVIIHVGYYYVEVYDVEDNDHYFYDYRTMENESSLLNIILSTTCSCM